MKSNKSPSPAHRLRLENCRQAMKRDGITSYLVSHQPDYHYLTGFTGEDSAVLIQPKQVHVISDSRFDEAINQECPWVRRWMRKQSLNDEIAKVCTKLRIKTLALQPDRVTLAAHKFLRKHAKGTKLVHAGSIIAPMRSCKEPSELAVMQRAIAVAEESFIALRRTLRVGQTELEIAARLEYEMKTRGASGSSFGTICAEGPNAALPHAHAGNRKLIKGSALLVDWGARVGNYCSDLTRVLFIGSIPRKLGEVYRIVLEAQQSAIAAMRPGARMCDVDAVARDFIKNAGYGDYFGHGLGHGLGLEVHEPPSLSWRSEEPLAEGMVVTVEPGIYLPGVGGVRIEDDVLVTAKGVTVLSGLDRSLAGSVI